ncbi:MAG: hypothetical protein ACK5O7_01040 [Holosporales bacterium]
MSIERSTDVDSLEVQSKKLPRKAIHEVDYQAVNTALHMELEATLDRISSLEKERDACYQELFESSRHIAYLSQQNIRLKREFERYFLNKRAKFTLCIEDTEGKEELYKTIYVNSILANILFIAKRLFRRAKAFLS